LPYHMLSSLIVLIGLLNIPSQLGRNSLVCK
jgi:hypothetical protein